MGTEEPAWRDMVSSALLTMLSGISKACENSKMLYIFDDYTLNRDLYELRYKGERSALEPQVYEVPSYLVQHRDRVISKQELVGLVRPACQ